MWLLVLTSSAFSDACRVFTVNAAILGALTACSRAVPSGPHPISLDVRFALTDVENVPVPGAKVRLVFGSESDWQNPTAGYAFETDDSGARRFTADVTLDRRLRKYPSNFVSSLLSSQQPTDYLMVGAEMEYAGFRWLYAVDVYRFPNGTDVLHDGFSVHTPDAHERFTNKATHDSTPPPGRSIWRSNGPPRRYVGNAWRTRVSN
jgi:hypothetical protein